MAVLAGGAAVGAGGGAGNVLSSIALTIHLVNARNYNNGTELNMYTCICVQPRHLDIIKQA